MEATCLSNVLSDAEHKSFEDNGYFIVEDALPPDLVGRLAAVTDRVDREQRRAKGLGPHDRMMLMDFVGMDEAYLELVDWPLTFPKVWGILGWNIQLYHSHMAVTPPAPPDAARDLGFGWHQDSDRLNREMETHPRPRISLKIAYFLSDCSEPGRGNFYIAPGTHLESDLGFPEGDRKVPPDGAMPVLVPAGSAVFFDRRLWHSVSNNFWTEPRRVLFYGYSYRWLRPRDDVSVEHFWDDLDPIRRQLFGASASGGHGYTSPQEEDVPLRAWIGEHLGPDAVIP